MHGRHDGADFRKGGRDTEQHGPDKTCPDSGLPGDCVTGSGEHVAGDQNDDGGEYGAEDDPAESRVTVARLLSTGHRAAPFLPQMLLPSPAGDPGDRKSTRLNSST